MRIQAAPRTWSRQIDGASGDYDVNGLGCETLKAQAGLEATWTGRTAKPTSCASGVASGAARRRGAPSPTGGRAHRRRSQTRIVCQEACPESNRRGYCQRLGGVAVPGQRLHPLASRKRLVSSSGSLLAFAELATCTRAATEAPASTRLASSEVPHQRRRLGSSSLAILGRRRPQAIILSEAEAEIRRIRCNDSRGTSMTLRGILRLRTFGAALRTTTACFDLVCEACQTLLSSVFVQAVAIIPMNCCIATIGGVAGGDEGQGGACSTCSRQAIFSWEERGGRPRRPVRAQSAPACLR